MISRLGSPALPWETVLTVFIAHLPSTQKYSASERISSRRNVTTEKCYSLLYYRLCFICLWIYVFVCSVNAAVKKRSEGKSAASDGHEIQFGLRQSFCFIFFSLSCFSVIVVHKCSLVGVHNDLPMFFCFLFFVFCNVMHKILST